MDKYNIISFILVIGTVIVLGLTAFLIIDYLGKYQICEPQFEPPCDYCWHKYSSIENYSLMMSFAQPCFDECNKKITELCKNGN